MMACTTVPLLLGRSAKALPTNIPVRSGARLVITRILLAMTQWHVYGLKNVQVPLFSSKLNFKFGLLSLRMSEICKVDYTQLF